MEPGTQNVIWTWLGDTFLLVIAIGESGNGYTFLIGVAIGESLNVYIFDIGVAILGATPSSILTPAFTSL